MKSGNKSQAASRDALSYSKINSSPRNASQQYRTTNLKLRDNEFEVDKLQPMDPTLQVELLQEINKYKYDVASCHSQINRLEQKIKELTENISNLNTEKEQLLIENNEIKSEKIMKLEQENEDLALRQKVQRLQNLKDNNEAELNDLRQSYDEIHSENISFQINIQNLSDQVEQLKAEKQTLKTYCDRLANEKAEALKQAEDREERENFLTIEELTKKNSALLEEKEELNSMVSDLLSRNDDYVQKNDKLEQSYNEVKDLIQQLKSILLKKKKNMKPADIVEAIKYQNQEMKVKLNSLTEDNTNKSLQIQEMSETIGSLNNENSNQKAEIDQITQENEKNKVFAEKYESTRQQNEILLNKNSSQEQSINDLKEQNRLLSAFNNEKANQIEKISAELDLLKKKDIENKNIIVELQNTITSNEKKKNNDISILLQQKEETEAELESKTKEYELLKASYDKIDAFNNMLNTSYNEANRQKEKNSALVNSLQLKVESLTLQLSKANDSNKAILSANDTLKSRLSACQNQVKDLLLRTEEYEQTKCDLSEAQTQIDQLTSLQSEYIKKIEEIKSQNKVLKTQFKTTQSEIDQITSEKNNTESTIEKLIQKNQDLKTKYRDLIQKVEENEELKSLLAAAKDQINDLSENNKKLLQRNLESKMTQNTLKAENDDLRQELDHVKFEFTFNEQKSKIEIKNISELSTEIQKENESLRLEMQKLKACSPKDYQTILDELTECRDNNSHLLAQIRSFDLDKVKFRRLEEENSQLKKRITSLQTSLENIESIQSENALSSSYKKQLSESRRNNDMLVSENKKLSRALASATSENKKLKSSQEKLQANVSNSIMIMSDLQTENDELKESLCNASPRMIEAKRQRTKFDEDEDLSIDDLSSDDQQMTMILQSISDVKESVNHIDNYVLQSQLKSLTGKIENIAKDALKKSKR